MWKQLFWFVILLTIVEFCISDEPQATTSGIRRSARLAEKPKIYKSCEEEESDKDENTKGEQRKERMFRKRKCQTRESGTKV